MSRQPSSPFGRLRAFLRPRVERSTATGALSTGPSFGSLTAYVETIDAFHAQRPDMDAIRRFNHEMMDAIGKVRPLRGRRILDVGASPHGYGLERALALGASMYVGIGLAVREPAQVRDDGRSGWLINANAEDLAFAAESFDAVLSVSTFEHFSDGARVLREIHRVLKPEGIALFHFEPVWTCSYGHHLHHYPSLGRLIPPWAHLLWGEDEMRAALQSQWPDDAPISLEEAVEWVYRGSEINRLDVVALRRLFDESDLEIEWVTPLMDDETADKPTVARYLSTLLPYSADQLMTRGFAILMRKRAG